METGMKKGKMKNDETMHGLCYGMFWMRTQENKIMEMYK